MNARFDTSSSRAKPLSTFLYLSMVALALLIFSPMSGQTQLGGDIDGEAAGDRSGEAVSLSADGNIMAIGGPRNAGNFSLSGHVRVHRWQNGAWTQLGTDIDGYGSVGRWGHAVSLSANGHTVVIGAPSVFMSEGEFRIYRWQNGVWDQLGAPIYGGTMGDQLGKAVSLSADGNVVAIGAPLNDANGNGSGRVRIYRWQNGAWTQWGNDIEGEATGDLLGSSVSLAADGHTLAIGAPSVAGAGHVRVYHVNNSGTWTQLGTDLDGTTHHDTFGYSVSLSADGLILAVGAPASNHVRIYRWQNEAWTPLGSDIYGVNVGDELGYSVALSANGQTLAVGAPEGYPGGYTHIYRWQNGAWNSVGNPIVSEKNHDQAGWSVSLSADGERVAIGAPGNDDNGNDAGHVRAYTLPAPPPANRDLSAPLLHYPFNGNTQDATPNHIHGTNHGGTFVADRFGNAQSALSFDGINDYVESQGSSLLDNLTGSATFSFWLQLDAFDNGSHAPIYSKSTSSENQYDLVFINNGRFVYGGNGPYCRGEAEPVSTAGDWVFYTLVKEAQFIKLYQDGVEVASEPLCSFLSGSRTIPFEIGRDRAGATEYLDGSLDDFRIYDWPLSAEEVNALYQQPDAPLFIDNLLLHYPFDGNTRDATVNTLHGTNLGATFVEDRFGSARSALLFDGVDDYVAVQPSSLLDNLTGDASFTFWIQLNDWDNGWAPVLSKSLLGSGQSNIQYNLALRDVGNVQYAGGFCQISNYASPLQPDGNWHFFALVKGQDRDILYRDGVEVGSVPACGFSDDPTTIPLEIGRDLYGASESLNGALDDLRIYRKALTPNEVTAIYSNNVVATSLEDSPQPFPQVKAYPNPSSGHLAIEIQDARIQSLRLIDLAGRQIPAQVQLTGPKAQLEASYQGLALLIIETDQGTQTQKVRFE